MEKGKMDDTKIVGLSTHPEYAKWAHRETDPGDVCGKPEALDDMLVLTQHERLLILVPDMAALILNSPHHPTRVF